MTKGRLVLFWLSGAYLVLLLVASFVIPMWQDPTVTVNPVMTPNPLTGVMKPMSINLPPSGEHWLGTDQSGRDILSRLAQGARNSLLIGLSVEIIVIFVGVIVAVLGVFAPKWIAYPLMRLTDAMFAFPDILLAILLVGLLRSAKIPENTFWSGLFTQGFIPVIIALSITAWPGLTRIVRGLLASLKDREYVVAARATGASTKYVVLKHILPQLWGVLLAISMVDLAGVILAESTLSFIGIGVQPPNPSWGNMIDKARQDMDAHPLPLFYACFVLSLTIFALNFVGDGLRALSDPKSK